ncbi:SMI1/KNR4 family protein [Deinococcus peraridilitoris]|uniref:Knr4/Smi1-like domain-containing protein n=1 Tax=Deinococcus peraridilitoris (strain DSM 19664 / LMG 22246 / CIP 109416 / KR-200) TaxID=937777 RepID=L0A3G8_DEIPD|nr:SMI1/KNR4 family protein [Deinococcus peraridilitoris]AFZ67717.1 hypothetical protein Deipe_2232 [Deinococcus peraridilitoris DSM 19664]
MSDADWDQLFDEQHERPPGATPAQLEQLNVNLFRPFSTRELAEANIVTVMDAQHIAALKDDAPQLLATAQRSPAHSWVLPKRQLPITFLDLLRWSDGPIVAHKKLFLQFFTTSGINGIREMLLAYHFPKYLPGFVPFALDGCGNFAAFDMRGAPANGEYPIVAMSSGNLFEDDAVVVADNFVEFCYGSRSLESYLFD